MFAMYSRQTREQKESQREEEKDERERTESQSTGREMSRGNARRSDNHASPALRSQRDQKRTNLVKNERGDKKKGRAFLPTEYIRTTRKGKTGDVYAYTDVSIDVISLGRWMEGLRSKDDRKLDRIHTHTSREADGV